MHELPHMLGQDEGGHVLEHRDLDILPFAGLVAVQQCHEHELNDDEADDVVGHDHRQVARLAMRAVVGRRHA